MQPKLVVAIVLLTSHISANWFTDFFSNVFGSCKPRKTVVKERSRTPVQVDATKIVKKGKRHVSTKKNQRIRVVDDGCSEIVKDLSIQSVEKKKNIEKMENGTKLKATHRSLDSSASSSKSGEDLLSDPTIDIRSSSTTAISKLSLNKLTFDGEVFIDKGFDEFEKDLSQADPYFTLLNNININTAGLETIGSISHSIESLPVRDKDLLSQSLIKLEELTDALKKDLEAGRKTLLGELREMVSPFNEKKKMEIKKTESLNKFQHHQESLLECWQNLEIPYESEQSLFLARKYSVQKWHDNLLLEKSKPYVEKMILGNPKSPAIYKVKGDGDCGYRSFIMGLVHNIKTNPVLVKSVHTSFSATRRIFKMSQFFKNMDPKTKEVISNGIVLINHVLSVEFVTFNHFYQLMENIALSRAIIFTLRHLVAFNVMSSMQLETMPDFLGITTMGTYAGALDLNNLGNIFSAKTVIHDLNKDFGGDQEFGDLVNSKENVIALAFAGEHFDLLVDSWTQEDNETYSQEEMAELEEVKKIADNF